MYTAQAQMSATYRRGVQLARHWERTQVGHDVDVTIRRARASGRSHSTDRRSRRLYVLRVGRVAFIVASSRHPRLVYAYKTNNNWYSYWCVMDRTVTRLLNSQRSRVCCYWILTLFALGEESVADAIGEVNAVLCWTDCEDVCVEREGPRAAGDLDSGHQDIANPRSDDAGRRQEEPIRLHG